jgi:hypothetical protein
MSARQRRELGLGFLTSGEWFDGIASGESSGAGYDGALLGLSIFWPKAEQRVQPATWQGGALIGR